jgi:hypothetical protein
MKIKVYCLFDNDIVSEWYDYEMQQKRIHDLVI